jgi:hypothetical protein
MTWSKLRIWVALRDSRLYTPARIIKEDSAAVEKTYDLINDYNAEKSAINVRLHLINQYILFRKSKTFDPSFSNLAQELVKNASLV